MQATWSDVTNWTVRDRKEESDETVGGYNDSHHKPLWPENDDVVQSDPNSRLKDILYLNKLKEIQGK